MTGLFGRAALPASPIRPRPVLGLRSSESPLSTITIRTFLPWPALGHFYCSLKSRDSHSLAKSPPSSYLIRFPSDSRFRKKLLPHAPLLPESPCGPATFTRRTRAVSWSRSRTRHHAPARAAARKAGSHWKLVPLDAGTADAISTSTSESNLSGLPHGSDCPNRPKPSRLVAAESPQVRRPVQ